MKEGDGIPAAVGKGIGGFRVEGDSEEEDGLDLFLSLLLEVDKVLIVRLTSITPHTQLRERRRERRKGGSFRE